jgi:cytochrome P450
VSYSPYDPAIHADPYPVYAWLRAEHPVYRNEELDFWALSRHADVSAAFSDTKRLSNANGNSIEPASWGPNACRYASILAMDTPDHTRVRGRIARFFGTLRIATIETYARNIIRAELSQALRHTEFDFISNFTERFPARVLSELLGISESDRDEIQRLTELIVERPEGSHDIPAEAIKATLTLMELIRKMIADRRRESRDDLISALMDGSDATQISSTGKSVSEDEAAALLNLIISAGADTVMQLLGNAWYWAWRNPDQSELAFAGNVPGWIEETLRYDTPSQLAARTAVEDIDIHGTVIPAGGRVLLLPGAANRDGTVFRDPDRYDLTRDTSAKVTFGGGRHICLGVRLARLEARIALEELTAVIADYDIDESGARRVTSAEARGFAALPTTVRLR